MPRPSFQFRLGTVFLIVTCSAIYFAVARTDVGRAILAIGVASAIALAIGLAVFKCIRRRKTP